MEELEKPNCELEPEEEKGPKTPPDQDLAETKAQETAPADQEATETVTEPDEVSEETPQEELQSRKPKIRGADCTMSRSSLWRRGK